MFNSFQPYSAIGAVIGWFIARVYLAANRATEVASGIAGFALVDNDPVKVLFHVNLLSIDEGEDEGDRAQDDAHDDGTD